MCLWSWLQSISGCSNAYNTKLGSHTHDVLPIAATETFVYGHRTSGNTNFWFWKIVCYSIDLWLRLSSQRSCDHIQWFQWLQLAIHHGYVTLGWCHKHWNSQKCLKVMIISTAMSCTKAMSTHCIGGLYMCTAEISNISNNYDKI